MLQRNSRDFDTPIGLVRNLYQEVQLRYQQVPEEKAKEQFVDLIRKQSFEKKGKRIVFVVRDPMLAQYFQDWVAQVDGFTDTSFNPNLVSIHIDILVKVLDKISVAEIGEFPEEADILNDAESRPALLRLFGEELMKSAGNEAGKMSIRGLVAGISMLLGVAG